MPALRLARRAPAAQRFLTAVILFFVGCIQLFFLGGRAGVPHLGFVFFVWVGIFSLTTIAQFWSYANEIYARADGRPPLPAHRGGLGGGRPAGGRRSPSASSACGVSPFLMMQIAAGSCSCTSSSTAWSAAAWRPAARRAGPGRRCKAGNGFALVLKSRYLRLIALLLVLLNLVNTVGEFILARRWWRRPTPRLAADAGFDKEASSARFYGSYFFWVNVAPSCSRPSWCRASSSASACAGVVLALPLVALGAYGLAAAGAGLMALLLDEDRPRTAPTTRS